jgi:hypothetical protein
MVPQHSEGEFTREKTLDDVNVVVDLAYLCEHICDSWWRFRQQRVVAQACAKSVLVRLVGEDGGMGG